MGVSNDALQNLLRLQQQQASISGRGGPDESGILTGPILQRRREKRESAAAEESQAAQLELAGQRGQTLFSAQGFGPDFAATQQGQAFQQGLADPGTRDQTLQTIQNLRTTQATATDRLAQRGLAEDRFQQEVQENVFQSENALRGEWQKMIAPTVAIMQGVDFARSQMELGSPAAAFNSARLFIQQLDQSMITNPEIEAQLAAQGASGQLANLKSWLAGGGQFDQVSREQMVNSMASIGAVMQQHGDVLADQMTELVGRSDLGLNAENVVTLGGFGNRGTDLSVSEVVRPPLLQGGAGTPDPDLGQQAIGTAIGEMLTLPDGTEVRRID